MSGFISPNHTQTPNDLFDEHMRHMTEAELKIVLTVVRNTLGWHRASHPVSLTVFEKMTGLSRQACIDGVNAATEHGFILADRAPGKTTTYTLNVSDGLPASQNSRPVKATEESTEWTGTGQNSRPAGSQDSRLIKEIEEKQIPSNKKKRKKAAAAEIEIQETIPVEEISSPAQPDIPANPDAAGPIPGSAAPLPTESGTDVPPAVLNGLGMPGSATVARQERQAADYRKVVKHPLYVAFTQAWAESLPGKSAAEREALIPALRPDNASRHLDTIKLLELMQATPDHVRMVVAAKREAGKPEYPFAWLPDDVQKQIVAKMDANTDHARATESAPPPSATALPEYPPVRPLNLDRLPQPTWAEVAALNAQEQLNRFARQARMERERKAAHGIRDTDLTEGETFNSRGDPHDTQDAPESKDTETRLAIGEA